VHQCQDDLRFRPAEQELGIQWLLILYGCTAWRRDAGHARVCGSGPPSPPRSLLKAITEVPGSRWKPHSHGADVADISFSAPVHAAECTSTKGSSSSRSQIHSAPRITSASAGLFADSDVWSDSGIVQSIAITAAAPFPTAHEPAHALASVQLASPAEFRSTFWRKTPSKTLFKSVSRTNPPIAAAASPASPVPEPSSTTRLPSTCAGRSAQRGPEPRHKPTNLRT
jgi:hypothetical protein